MDVFLVRCVLRTGLAFLLTCAVFVDAWPRERAMTRTQLATELCFAAIGDDEHEGLLDTCTSIAPEILSGGFVLSEAMSLCRGFAMSPEKRLSCYGVLNRGSAHQGFKRAYYACLDETVRPRADDRVECIEGAIVAVLETMRRDVNGSFAESLCRKVHESKRDRTACLDQREDRLATANAVELALDICDRATSPARRAGCFQSTFRLYRDSESMNERLKECRRVHPSKSAELSNCLRRHLEEVLAAYLAREERHETVIRDALAGGDP